MTNFNRSLLHEERIKAGLTMTELAEKMGVSQSMISKWENGDCRPRDSSLNKLCEFFQVDKDYFEHFYHQPLGSFQPKPRASEEAKRNFEPHTADKNKVRENLEKINGKTYTLEAENEALKSEIARLKGVIEGMKMGLNIKANKDDEVLLVPAETKKPWWQRLMG